MENYRRDQELWESTITIVGGTQNCGMDGGREWSIVRGRREFGRDWEMWERIEIMGENRELWKRKKNSERERKNVEAGRNTKATLIKKMSCRFGKVAHFTRTNSKFSV